MRRRLDQLADRAIGPAWQIDVGQGDADGSDRLAVRQADGGAVAVDPITILTLVDRIAARPGGCDIFIEGFEVGDGAVGVAF